MYQNADTIAIKPVFNEVQKAVGKFKNKFPSLDNLVDVEEREKQTNDQSVLTKQNIHLLVKN